MKFEYGFKIDSNSDGIHKLVFLDIPSLIITHQSRDKIFTQAQSVLDDYLYNLLKEGKKIPLPQQKASQDKRIMPSEAIAMALSLYTQD